MDNLFGIHEKESRRYSKARAKEFSRKKTSSGSSMAVRSGAVDRPGFVFRGQYFETAEDWWEDFSYKRFKTTEHGTKWERIGRPMVMNTFDQFIILNPLLPPRMRYAAAMRQFHEYQRLSE